MFAVRFQMVVGGVTKAQLWTEEDFDPSLLPHLRKLSPGEQYTHQTSGPDIVRAYIRRVSQHWDHLP